MSPAMTGAWFGLLLGFLSFALLRWVASTMERKKNADRQQEMSARLLRATAIADLVMFPVIGYIVGPMVLNG